MLYLSSNCLAIKVEWEFFASVLVDFGLNLLALFLSIEANVYVDGDRKAKETLSGVARERRGGFSL